MKNLAKNVRKVSSEAYAENNKDFKKAYESITESDRNLNIAKDVILLEMQATIEAGGVELGGFSEMVWFCAGELGFTGSEKEKLISNVMAEF